ncbi:MAG: GNAT family N-acetyltransferase [Candidatus Nanohalobium sp.]
MEIREAESSEAGKIVEELWLPLAQEMEEVSDYNQLKEGLGLQETIEHKREKLQSNDSYFYIAEESGKKAGFISATVKDSPPIFKRGPKLKINEIFVKEDFRRKGIASELMDRIDEVAESGSVDTIELEVNVRNDSAKELYRKHGFKVEREKMVKNL